MGFGRYPPRSSCGKWYCLEVLTKASLRHDFAFPPDAHEGKPAFIFIMHVPHSQSSCLDVKAACCMFRSVAGQWVGDHQAACSSNLAFVQANLVGVRTDLSNATPGRWQCA